ncbi:MAG: coenzyme F420-0:L-glutamate ligase [Actinomycetota bacterium]|nr:coenzyme F420-0:L-glutamate ligase [Actinomycetota bacterium]
MTEIRIIPIGGIGEIAPGDDVAARIADAGRAVSEREGRAVSEREGLPTGDEGVIIWTDGDVVVVTQKVVSKAEGRLVRGVTRREAALAESARILRRMGDAVISQTRHGLVCANAGVDDSNVPGDSLALLPVDPDRSARRIRARLEHLTGARLAVIISDTFGRAWRVGQTDVAIGVAGIAPLTDYRGSTDAYGRPLTATVIAVADEIAGAAEMVMGKSLGVCAAVVRGAPVAFGDGAATEIIRPAGEDLFR